MTDDRLTKFRSEVPTPDERTAQRVYDRATRGHRRLSRPWHVLGIAVVAICAAAAAALAAGAFTGGSRHTDPSGHGQPRPAIGEQGPAPMVLAYTRDRGVLRAVTVTLTTEVPHDRVRLQVLYTDISSVAELNRELAAGNGTLASAEVVYEREVSTTDTPLGPTGYSSPQPGWSFARVSLSPRDWTGGCETGFYNVTNRSRGGSGYSEWFRCRKG